MKHPPISVIFPTLNGEKVIGNLLKSVYRQKYPGKIEVIAADNASTDKTLKIIKKTYPKTKIIRFTKNLGSAPALNAAARLAKGQLILATNDDVIFDTNAFRFLVDCYQNTPNAGIVTGKMLYAKKPYSFAIPGFKINHYLGYHPYDLKNKNKIRECDWAVGACILIKKNLLKKIKYFDAKYIFCGEEYDLSFQIRRLGFKIIYSPKAIFYHHFSRNIKPNSATLFAHYRGKIRYLLKNGRLDHLLIFIPVHILFVPVFYIFSGQYAKTLAIYQAFGWNLANIKQTIKSRRQRPISVSL